MTDCSDSYVLECGCVPDIQYKCSKHRLPNQCPACNRIVKQLYASACGILCKDCLSKEKIIW